MVTLDSINWNNISFSGSGASGFVVTDGNYAIKFGFISEYDYNGLVELSNVGLAVPVHYYATGVTLPDTIMNALKNVFERVDNYGYYDNYPSMDSKTYSVMIMGIAIPVYKKDSNIDWSKAGKLINWLQAEINARLGKSWSDDHLGNVGVYNNSLVILDV